MKRLKKYKKQLLKAGFTEAKRKPYSFFRKATEKTAFIVNLTENDSAIGILYGFCSTAFMTGEEAFFKEYGSDDTSCNLRRRTELKSEDDEPRTGAMIQDFYTQFRNYEKDELLDFVKERRKAFLQNFTALLKPSGFRKKGNKWVKPLADTFTLTLEAQKSAFSDQYYFNVTIDRTVTENPTQCYYSRIVENSDELYNWQLMDDFQLECLQNDIKKELDSISATDIEELGKQKRIRANCLCSRKHCDDCPIEMNMWEMAEAENK